MVAEQRGQQNLLQGVLKYLRSDVLGGGRPTISRQAIPQQAILWQKILRQAIPHNLQRHFQYFQHQQNIYPTCLDPMAHLSESKPETQSRNSSFNPSLDSALTVSLDPVSDQPVECDVAIVGGGVAGMTLACALSQRGFRVTVIDTQTPQEAAQRLNVYAVSLLSGQIFTGLGIWDQILPRIAQFHKIRLSDADYPGVVTFEPGDLRLDRLGYVAEHQPLIEALHAYAQDQELIQVIAPATVQQATYDTHRATLTLASKVGSGKTLQTLTTRLVIAADGARSQLREAAGIRQRGWKYWQSCVTFKLKPEKSHENIAYEKFWANGPFAILPLTGDRCNVVWTSPHAEAEALMRLDEAEFLAKMRRHFGDQMGELELISPRRLFPVQLKQSDRYVLPRLALVGDAAHCCHPVGGQGLNLGIRDVAALAEVLSEARERGEDIGSIVVLKRYERWRKWENGVILAFTDFLDRLFSNQILPIVIVRRLGLGVLRSLFPLKQFTLRLMTGLLGRQPAIAPNPTPYKI